MQILRRRRLVTDLLRIEYVLTDRVHVLDLDSTLDDAGLSNDCTIVLCPRVRGGSTPSRLRSERTWMVMDIAYFKFTSMFI